MPILQTADKIVRMIDNMQSKATGINDPDALHRIAIEIDNILFSARVAAVNVWREKGRKEKAREYDSRSNDKTNAV